MIVESKGAQLFFFFLGLALCVSGIYGFANLDDVRFNFCISTTGSVFFNTLNDVLVYLSLALTFILGLLSFWLVSHSVVECRKFSGEGAPFDKKKFFRTIRAYGIMIGVIAGIVILLNAFVLEKAVVKYGMNGRDLTGEVDQKRHESITCVGEVISFKKREPFETGNAISRFYGISTLRINSPLSEKGRILSVKVLNDDKNKKLWSTVGAIVQFNISESAMKGGKSIESNSIYPLQR